MTARWLRTAVASVALALVTTAPSSAAPPPGSPSASPTASAVESSWPQFGRVATHLHTAPDETAFTPETIDGLSVEWKGQLNDFTTNTGGAAVEGGFAYVGGTDGVLSVFAAGGCGAAVCQPLWRGSTDNGIFSTPAVIDDIVLVGSADHFLYAFPAAGCGASECEPSWRGQLEDAALASSPAVADGTAYLGDFSGRLYAFPVAGCGEPICEPAWVGRGHAAEQITSAPAVANGHVYVGTFANTFDRVSGRLLVFDAAGCGEAVCRATWRANIHGPVGGNGAPVVAGDVVYIGSGTEFSERPDSKRHLFAFPADGCGADRCDPLWSYRTDDLGVVAGPAVSGDVLYASVQATPDPNTVGVVAAYPAEGCGSEVCDALWTGVNFASGFESPPVVTGGLVLVAKGPASGFPVDAAVLSYPADGCGSDVCEALSFTQVGLEQNYSGAPLAVAAGTIFMASQESSGPSFLYALTTPG